ncbi:MAG: IS21 family transposase [Alphaproteobacteria bacterium]|nr:IS21 family transposase [Alphaproteobacteria bacterium]
MISTEEYAEIRQCKKNGLSMRRTAEMLGMSRHTVKRYWDGAHLPDERKDYPHYMESEQKKLIMEALEKYFEENQTIGKQQVNAQTAWKALRETYHVGESTVRRYVNELRGKNPEGFIPLSFDPGEMMQVDWCEVKVKIKGSTWKAPVFCAVLPYSYAVFAMIMPNMQMPCFIEAHACAFSFFGGIPQRIMYDNLRTAVFSGAGRYAVKQEKFKLMEAHYAYESVFANRKAGNEKGGVENLCAHIRQVAFTPIPEGNNLKEIQDHVLCACRDYIRFRRIRDRPEPVVKMYEEERLKLMPLPLKPYSSYAEVEAIVASDLTFVHDATKYSVPQDYIGKQVTLRVFAYQIEAWYRGKLIYTYDRSFIKGDHQYIPEHYLPLLQRKKRAIPNAVPLKYGVMPPALEKFRKLNSDKDKYEQLASILLLGRYVDEDVLLSAVDWANRTMAPTFNSVRFYLESHNIETGFQDDTVSESIDMVIVDEPQFDGYDALLSQGDNEDE